MQLDFSHYNDQLLVLLARDDGKSEIVVWDMRKDKTVAEKVFPFKLVGAQFIMHKGKQKIISIPAEISVWFDGPTRYSSDIAQDARISYAEEASPPGLQIWNSP